jgi:Fe-S cluster assembly scaffold protein SufB
MKLPTWANLKFPPVDFQDISYYSKPLFATKEGTITPEVKKTFDKLGIPLDEQKDIAMDVVLDSVSVGTTYKKRLEKYGVILCPISEAISKYPEIVKKCNLTESKFYIQSNNINELIYILNLLNERKTIQYLKYCKYSGFNSRIVLESISYNDVLI